MPFSHKPEASGWSPAECWNSNLQRVASGAAGKATRRTRIRDCGCYFPSPRHDIQYVIPLAATVWRVARPHAVPIQVQLGGEQAGSVNAHLNTESGALPGRRTDSANRPAILYSGNRPAILGNFGLGPGSPQQVIAAGKILASPRRQFPLLRILSDHRPKRFGSFRPVPFRQAGSPIDNSLGALPESRAVARVQNLSVDPNGRIQVPQGLLAIDSRLQQVRRRLREDGTRHPQESQTQPSDPHSLHMNLHRRCYLSIPVLEILSYVSPRADCAGRSRPASPRRSPDAGLGAGRGPGVRPTVYAADPRGCKTMWRAHSWLRHAPRQSSGLILSLHRRLTPGSQQQIRRKPGQPIPDMEVQRLGATRLVRPVILFRFTQTDESACRSSRKAGHATADPYRACTADPNRPAESSNCRSIPGPGCPAARHIEVVSK